MTHPYISIITPIYDMKHADFFFERLQNSLEMQTFRNFEVIITREGGMAENTNAGLRKAAGDLVKILYMDDYLAHENSLQRIVDHFALEDSWLVTGCTHDPGGNVHFPAWNDHIHEGVNSIGSPSVLTMRRSKMMLFDEKLTWMLDCDLYRRMHDAYGMPVMLNDINVVIGVGDHQATHTLSDDIKNQEHDYMLDKYHD